MSETENKNDDSVPRRVSGAEKVKKVKKHEEGVGEVSFFILQQMTNSN